MRKFFWFWGFFGVLFLFLGLPLYQEKHGVRAYVEKDCWMVHWAEFDSDRFGTGRNAVLENTSSRMMVSFQRGDITGCDDEYEGFISWGSGWRQGKIFCSSSEVFVEVLNVSWTDTGDYGIAAYLRPKGEGEIFYCDNTVVQVYREEGVNLPDGLEGTLVRADRFVGGDYISGDITSISGNWIAAVKYTVDRVTRISVCDCLDWDRDCGSYNFSPSRYLETTDLVGHKRPFVFLEGGEKEAIQFKIVPDNRVGTCCFDVNQCVTTARIPDAGSVIVYTRPSPEWDPPDLIPENPCSKVYGYVKTQLGVGISGAAIDINTVDSDTCSGGNAGYGDPVSGEDGYWEVSNDIDMECLKIIESNATGYIDDGDPDVPVGAAVWNENWAVWSDPPVGECGPFTFYDIWECVPVCDDPLCGQADGCGGTCPDTDAGMPADSVIVSPNGMIESPTLMVGTSEVGLVWGHDNVNDLTDWFSIKVWNVGTGTTELNALVEWPSLTTPTGGLEYGETYYWQVRAINDTCDVEYGPWSDEGYFIFNRMLTYNSFLLKNFEGTNVDEDGDSRNHICQSEFDDVADIGDRQTIMRVTISDEDGGDTVDEVWFRLGVGGSYLTASAIGLTGVKSSDLTGVLSVGASFWTDVSTSWSGNDRTVDFPIEFESDFAMAIYDMEVYAKDNLGSTVPWTDVGRDFKVWDCQVGVSGTLYDGTDVEVSCPLVGFDVGSEVGEEMHFTDLSFEGLDGAVGETMAVTSPSYVDGGNKLTWSSSYTSLGGFNADLTGSIPIARITIPSGYQCGWEFDVDGGIVSAYDVSPALTIDFSSVLDQEAWFQVVGAGMGARASVSDRVPYTCVTDPDGVCRAAMTVGTMGALGVGRSDNGLVSAGSVSNNSTCSEEDCPYGVPHNWSLEEDVMGENCAYQDFYNKYYVREGVGTVYGGDVTMDTIATDTGGTGVVFVNGNVDIDEDSIVSSGDFLMIIASGSISVDVGVERIDGILVADGGITAEGTSNDQLVINGSLCSAEDSVSLSRSYTDESDNNTSPAVVIDFRPDFIFNMPGELTKVLSGWKEGN